MKEKGVEKRTFVRKCKCSSEFQDEKYGLGMRVMNATGKEGKVIRCTVCSAETYKQDKGPTYSLVTQNVREIYTGTICSGYERDGGS